MKRNGNFPIKTTLDNAALENGTTDHNASQLAARHETAARQPRENAGPPG
jgi:hypothetical protein